MRLLIIVAIIHIRFFCSASDSNFEFKLYDLFVFSESQNLQRLPDAVISIDYGDLTKEIADCIDHCCLMSVFFSTKKTYRFDVAIMLFKSTFFERFITFESDNSPPFTIL